MQKAYQDNYLEERVLSASPVELVCLLYGGAVEAVDRARECLAGGDIAGRARAIAKASAIVSELVLSLKPVAPVEAELRRLYDYMLTRLAEANRHQTDAPLADVRGLLSTLLESWRQVPAEPLASAASQGRISLSA